MGDIDNSSKHLIFVYGTLKRGCRNNHYLKDATFLGEAETIEKYSMRKHEYWYPAVIESLEHYNIRGELWTCSDWTLKCLDRLEGTPDLFYRKEVPIIHTAGVIHAWVYFFNYPYRKGELKEQILEWEE